MELAWPQPMLSVKVSFWLTDTTSPDSGAMRIVPRSHLSNELPPSYGAAVGPRGKDVDTGAGGMKDSMVIGRGVLATGEPEGAIDLAVKAGSAVIFEKRTWHSRTINSQPYDEARRCMTLIYLNWWQKVGPDVLEAGARLDAAGKMTPLRRQLFGMEPLYSERRASPTAVDGVWMSRQEMEPKA